MRKLAGIALGLAAACATGSHRPILVSDADYGRLQPGQTQLVEAARADRGTAHDAVARAKLRQMEAKHEIELAMADEKAVDAERMRAESAVRSAKESNDPAQAEAARAVVETAQLRKRTADAHLAYAKKLQALRDAEVVAAEKHLAYQDLRVEQAKLQSLQAAQIPAAAKYDATALQARVTKATREAQQADAHVATATTEMTNAGRQWQELDRQLQARGGVPAARG
jgi:hypothetical protein